MLQTEVFSELVYESSLLKCEFYLVKQKPAGSSECQIVIFQGTATRHTLVQGTVTVALQKTRSLSLVFLQLRVCHYAPTVSHCVDNKQMWTGWNRETQICNAPVNT